MEKWCKFDKCKMKMMDAVMLLDQIIDESDPDVINTRVDFFLFELVLWLN